jgi:hypothetical protein
MERMPSLPTRPTQPSVYSFMPPSLFDVAPRVAHYIEQIEHEKAEQRRESAAFWAEYLFESIIFDEGRHLERYIDFLERWNKSVATESKILEAEIKLDKIRKIGDVEQDEHEVQDALQALVMQTLKRYDVPMVSDLPQTAIEKMEHEAKQLVYNM